MLDPTLADIFTAFKKLKVLVPDVPAEQAITKSAVNEGSQCSPGLQLATDVIIGTPHGYKFASPTRITFPLRGDGQVKKVLVPL